MEDKFQMIAKTMYGLEDVLADELKGIGAAKITKSNRAVYFEGNKETLYRANIQLHTALKILIPLATFDAKNEVQLYNMVKEVEWDKYISTSDTVAVDGVVNSTKFNHSKFVSLKVKDAVVDQFRDKYNRRPSVDASNPTLRIHIHIDETTCTLSIDSSGESLHKRGYRNEQGTAPINEVLAAGMILLAGWKGDCHFIDPMCGSGTIVIEAAMIAYGIPPGIFRKGFAFENWNDFDPEIFNHLMDSDEYYKEFEHQIIGSDISAQTLRIALMNTKSASLHKKIELKASPFNELEPPEGKCMVITNPPYGERLKPHQLNNLYKSIGDTLKKIYSKNQTDAWIISSNTDALKRIGLRPSKKIKLINGKLECGFYQFKLYSGSKKSKYQKQFDGDTADKGKLL
ncbi:MAG: RNA methyltransferase [Bacteroidetes bacterium]|jgi:putative N6-adenine-specific DNA methylase|nr:RNA methyltransferase [Bacteroidota bacterium]